MIYRHFVKQFRSARRIGCVTGAAIVTLERKEVRRRTRQTSGHEHRLGIGGEVTKVRRLNSKDRLARFAVLVVLPARILNALAPERVLQFHRGAGMPFPPVSTTDRYALAKPTRTMTGRQLPIS